MGAIIIPAMHIGWQYSTSDSSTGGDVEAAEVKAVQDIMLPIVGTIGGEDSIMHMLWKW